ncbi:MAG: hypothetical protein ABID61_00010 [Candidatus Micrarchaeota archaeon]
MGRGKRMNSVEIISYVQIINFSGKGYVCKIRGEGKKERITILGRVDGPGKSLDDASFDAETLRTAKGGKVALALVDEKYYVINPINSMQAQQLEKQIAEHRRNGRVAEFKVHHSS